MAAGASEAERMLESGLGLKRTKGGVGDKEAAYLVQRSNVSKFGILLIAISVLCLVIGLSMEMDLAHTTKQVAREQQRVVAHKKALLVTRELDQLDNAQQEAKLIKVLSLIQAHFARDRKEAEMMVAFHKRFNAAMIAHKKAIDVVLAELDGNPKVVAYLREQLYASAKDFHIRTASVAKRYGAAITTEGQEAEARLHKLTQSILSELDADVKEEKQETAQEAALERSDPEWKKMAAEYNAKNPMPKSQDQRDVTSMITHFEKHVQDLPENTLTLSEIEAAKAKLESFQRGEGTYDEISHEVDRFFGAAQVPVPDVSEQAQLLVKYEEVCATVGLFLAVCCFSRGVAWLLAVMRAAAQMKLLLLACVLEYRRAGVLTCSRACLAASLLLLLTTVAHLSVSSTCLVFVWNRS